MFSLISFSLSRINLRKGKTLQSDYGAEYKSLALCLNEKLSILDILVLYTSTKQEERKHKHLVETSLTLLSQAGTSLSYKHKSVLL